MALQVQVERKLFLSQIQMIKKKKNNTQGVNIFLYKIYNSTQIIPIITQHVIKRTSS